MIFLVLDIIIIKKTIKKMVKISLFKLGLITMLFFIFASNVLNYVSIATNVWAENAASMLWHGCVLGAARDQCFRTIPPALIATGTALNCLSLVLIAAAQAAICNKRFRNSISLYFVIGSWIATLFSVVFSSTGWYFIFVFQYQQFSNNLTVYFGWSFWLMTPVFGCSVIAGIIGSAILGCTCVTNKYEREKRDQEKAEKVSMNNLPVIVQPSTSSAVSNQAYYPTDTTNDPQVLRL
jgi:hypothetical protein